MEKNPYIFDSSKLSPEQSRLVRDNNNRLFILTSNFQLIKDNKDNLDGFERLTLRLPKHVSRASSGTLLRTPKGMDITPLNKKLQGLMKELAENRPYPEYKDPVTNKILSAREVFFSSFFWQNLESFYAGDNYEKDPTRWSNYKHVPNTVYPSYIDPRSEAMSAAISIYVHDNQEVGFDMNNMLDTVIVSDGHGGYKLKPDNTFNTNMLIDEAVSNQIRILKENKVFKGLFYSPERDSNKNDPERY